MSVSGASGGNPLKALVNQLAKTAESAAAAASDAVSKGQGLAADAVDEAVRGAEVVQAASHVVIGTPRHATEPANDPSRLDAADIYDMQRRLMPFNVSLAKATVAAQNLHGIQMSSAITPNVLFAADVAVAAVGAAQAAAAGGDPASAWRDGLGAAQTARAERVTEMATAQGWATAQMVRAFDDLGRDAAGVVAPGADPRADVDRALSAGWSRVESLAAHAGESWSAFQSGLAGLRSAGEAFVRKLHGAGVAGAAEANAAIQDGLGHVASRAERAHGWAAEKVDAGIDRIAEGWSAAREALSTMESTVGSACETVVASGAEMVREDWDRMKDGFRWLEEKLGKVAGFSLARAVETLDLRHVAEAWGASGAGSAQE